VLALVTLALALPSAAADTDNAVSSTARKPAAVMSYLGWKWLERESREEEEKPYALIEAMDLKEGDVVADVCCGSGYYTRKIAKEVGTEGKVYGVDIQPQMLEMLKKLCEEESIGNIIPVLSGEADPKLPVGAIDWILLVDVYHEFSQPEAMLKKMRESLAPGGKVALVEYRGEDDSAAHIKAEHRMTVKQVLAEWGAGGYELVDLLEFLPSQHIFIFQARPSKN